MKRLAILLALSLGAGAWAQRVPVAITAPESLSAGQTGALTVVVVNTNPMERVEVTPLRSTVALTYTDLDQQRTVTAEATINVQRAVGGTPWANPSVVLALPAPLTMDINSVRFTGAAGSAATDIGGGSYRFSAPSLAAGGTWTTTATIKHP